MLYSSKTGIVFGVAVAAAVTLLVWQQRGRAGVAREKEALEQQRLALQNDNGRLADELAQAPRQQQAPQANYTGELRRLRSEAGALRLQTNRLQSLATKAAGNQPQTSAADPDAVLAVLPADYPRTPQATTQTMLDLFSRGDADEFFRYFGQPGGKKMYDEIFANEHVKSLIGMQVVSLGETQTNDIDSSMLMVPYKVRLQDGTERERVIQLVQDPETQRWYFKGGL